MYLQSLVAGAARVDLDGKAAGEVTAGDAEYAAAKLAEILASREAERAAAVEAKAPPEITAGGTSNGIAGALAAASGRKGLVVEGKTRAAPAGIQATAKARVSASEAPWRGVFCSRTGGEGGGLPFAGQAGGQARRARLAEQGPAQGLCGLALLQALTLCGS